MARNGAEMGDQALSRFDKQNKSYDGSRDNTPVSLRKQILKSKELEKPGARIKAMEFHIFNKELHNYIQDLRKYPGSVLNNFFSPRNEVERENFHKAGTSFKDVEAYLDINSSKYYMLNTGKVETTYSNSKHSRVIKSRP